MNPTTRIEEPQIERDARGKITRVSLTFGPHHFVEVFVENGKVHASLGSTHHGIKADASEVNGELEQLLNSLMHAHPDKTF